MVDTTDEWILQRDRHPRAAHRRSRRGDVRPRQGGGAQGDRAGRPHARRHRLHRRRHRDAGHDVSRAPRACMQHKIGAHHAWGFDLSAACSAFTYALTTASQLVATGAHDHALVVGADVMSSIIDYKDRATCVLFGDGAGAVVVSAAEDDERRDPRFRARDRRQRRRRAVHAGRRQPAPAVARDRRPAAALRQAGRAGGVQVRRPEDRGNRAPHSRAQRPHAGRPRSVRVAPGQPPHHPVGRREARPGRRTR